jgi:hypothetical protein
MAKLSALLSRFVCQSPRAICSALNMQSSLDGILHRAQRSQSPQVNSTGRHKDLSVLAALWTMSAIRGSPRMFFSPLCIFAGSVWLGGRAGAQMGSKAAVHCVAHAPASRDRHQMYLAARAITTIVSTTNAVICNQALLAKPVLGEICVSISVDHLPSRALER